MSRDFASQHSQGTTSTSNPKLRRWTVQPNMCDCAVTLSATFATSRVRTCDDPKPFATRAARGSAAGRHRPDFPPNVPPLAPSGRGNRAARSPSSLASKARPHRRQGPAAAGSRACTPAEAPSRAA
eukprot:4682263-Prymnesium_polylepis.1